MASFTLKFMFFTIFSLFCLVSVIIFPFLIQNPSINDFNQRNNLQQSFNISDLSKKVELRIKNGRVAEIILPEADPESYRHSSLFVAMFAGFFVIGFLVFAAFNIPPSPPPLNIQLVATYNNNMDSDDFSYDDIIGQGRFRHTFRCVFDFPGEKFICAVRLLNNTPKMRACVEKEARVQGCFEHPHVLPFVYYFYEDKFIYLLMGIAPNGAIRDRRPFLDEKDVAKVVLDSANALMAAHRQGIHHAKINSKKLYFGENNETKIADYGYCLHEERRPHWESEDVEDLLGVAADLLAFRKLSSLALEFLSTKHGTLANLVNHYWITMPR